MPSGQLGFPSSLMTQTNVWLITGCNSGFGRRLVTTALARGDRVIATARSLDKLRASRTEDPLPENLKLMQLDVTDSEEVLANKLKEAHSFFGRIDVLVNNAGFGMPTLVEEGGSTLLRQQCEANVFGLLNVTTATLPYMRQQRSGTVVIIGSRSSWRTELPGIGLYAATKAAARALGETLAVEIAPFNIRTLIVEPGAFRTEGIHVHGFHRANSIADYDQLRDLTAMRFASVGGTEKGDPDKAMEAVVDVVRGEGSAEGREWPLYLILGEDADENVREKCKKVLDTLDKWGHVSKGVSFE